MTFWGSMEDRIASCIVAMITYAMGRVASLHGRLVSAADRSTTVSGEMALRLLAYPAYWTNNVLFRIGYWLNCRRLDRGPAALDRMTRDAS